MRLREITAILPRYLDMVGNGAIIVYRDGSRKESRHRVETILRRLYRDAYLDEVSLRKKARKLLGIGRNLPLPYDSKRIFIPIKTRVPIGKNDGAHGYILKSAIKKIENERIYLFSGIEIKTLQKNESLDRAYQRANTLEIFLRMEEEKRALEYFK